MSAHLLFDDDGAFKAGTEMANAGTAHQVELPSGKRTKVKTSHVLLRFAEPTPAQLIERAQAQAAADRSRLPVGSRAAGRVRVRGAWRATISAQNQAPNKLRRCCFACTARRSIFTAKGRGRYRPAPAETLKAALAAVERKRKQEELRQQYVDELKAGRRRRMPLRSRQSRC